MNHRGPETDGFGVTLQGVADGENVADLDGALHSFLSEIGPSKPPSRKSTPPRHCSSRLGASFSGSPTS